MLAEESGASNQDKSASERPILPEDETQFATCTIGSSEATPAQRSAPTISCNQSGRGAWAKCGWPSKSSRSAGASPSN